MDLNDCFPPSPKESGHWYALNKLAGQPPIALHHHKEGYNLRDAKRDAGNGEWGSSPVPSVNGVQKVFNQFWPSYVGDGESPAEWGTRFHRNIESWYKGEEADEDQLPFVLPAVEIVADNGWEIKEHEQVLVDTRYGYGGTTDGVFAGENIRYGILDWKTRKNVKPQQKDIEQLAAYLVARFSSNILHKPWTRGVNVIVDSQEPGHVEVFEYGPEQLVPAWEAFKVQLWLWRYKNNYDPRSQCSTTQQ